MTKTHTVDRLALPQMSPGANYSLTVHRFGTAGARPKAYFQGSLHADETPGLLVAHHLLRQLIDADNAGDIVGEIIVVPMANPIGLAQNLDGYHVGRHNIDGGGNFNRGFPDFGPQIGDRLEGNLADDADSNVAAIRAALKQTVAEMETATAHQSLRRTLLSEAIDADIVLDLHCDMEALMHAYLGTPLWPNAGDLVADLGLRAVLLADDSGGGPFDECCGDPWWRLAKRFPDHPIPPACLASTIELRGQADVSDGLAQSDARGLMRFLRRRGVLKGEPGPLPNALCEATPLEATEIVKTSVAGVVAYAVELGDRVVKGDLIAEVIDPAASDPVNARTAIQAKTDGLVLSRQFDKLVRPGQGICKIVGTEPLADRKAGSLMED